MLQAFAAPKLRCVHHFHCIEWVEQGMTQNNASYDIISDSSDSSEDPWTEDQVTNNIVSENKTCLSQ
jgi:hypothetical protein